MKTIQPPERDKARIQRRSKDRRDLLLLDLETAKNRPHNFSFNQYLTNATSYLGYLVADEQQSSEICWTLNLLCKGTEALFAAAATTQAHMAVVLDDADGTSVALATRNAKGDAGLNYWEIGFSAALIVRRRTTLDALSSLSLDIIRNAEIKADECRYLYVEALQSFWQRRPDCTVSLLAAMKAADPSAVVVAPDYIAHIFAFEMELLFHILKLDAQAFNATLFEALTHFKLYFDTPTRRNHPYGFVALQLLPYAALAYDLDMPIEIDSAYLPVNLYSGACR